MFKPSWKLYHILVEPQSKFSIFHLTSQNGIRLFSASKLSQLQILYKFHNLPPLPYSSNCCPAHISHVGLLFEFNLQYVFYIFIIFTNLQVLTVFKLKNLIVTSNIIASKTKWFICITLILQFILQEGGCMKMKKWGKIVLRKMA